MNLGKDIRLPISWLNPYNFLTVFNGSTLQARSQHFIEVSPEFAPTCKMASLTPKSSIIHQGIQSNTLTFQ